MKAKNRNKGTDKRLRKFTWNLRQMELKIMENRNAVTELNQCNKSLYMVEILYLKYHFKKVKTVYCEN